MKSSTTKNLLGVINNNNLNFTKHISKLFKKASQKLYALALISNKIYLHK